MITVIAKYNDTTELSVYIKTGTYNTQELPCGIREAGNPELVKNGYKYHIQQLTTRKAWSLRPSRDKGYETSSPDTW